MRRNLPGRVKGSAPLGLRPSLDPPLSPGWHGGGISRLVPGNDEEIYRKYADELTRFASVLVGPDGACDVVSAAVLRVFGSSAWRQVSNERAYLYRAVLNESRMGARAERRRHALETRVASGDAGETIRTPRPEILAAVLELSPRQRAVVYLTYWEDLDPTRVAERLGVSDGSVRRHLARARKRLKETLHE